MKINKTKIVLKEIILYRIMLQRRAASSVLAVALFVAGG